MLNNIMKKIFLFFVILVTVFSCNKSKDPFNGEESAKEVMLNKDIFNGNSKWKITKMESDIEREFNQIKSKDWFSNLPECRKDNIYLFGEGGKNAIISVDEGEESCPPDGNEEYTEPDYVAIGVFLQFASDYEKAQADIEGEAMLKMFNIPYSVNLEFGNSTHTWIFKEIKENKLTIEAIITPDESEGMVEEKATVIIVFERII